MEERMDDVGTLLALLAMSLGLAWGIKCGLAKREFWSICYSFNSISIA